MKRPTLAATLWLVVLLGGCSSLLPHGHAFDVYRLPLTATPAKSTAASVNWRLRVDTPQAPPMLSSRHIVVMPSADKVSNYRDGQWAQRMPQLLRDRLIAAFRADGRVRGVSSNDDRINADFELNSTLDAFQAQYRGAKVPSVVLRLDARLLRDGHTRVLAAKRFSVAEPAKDSGLDSVVAAFGRAADRLSHEVVAWTIAQGRAHAAPPSANP